MSGLLQGILLILAFAGSINGAQNTTLQAAPTPGSPSLQETADWLKPHLVGVLHTSKRTVLTFRAKKGKEPKEVDRQGINTYESVSAASFDGCALTLGQLTRGDDYSVVTVTQIPLGLLTRVSWKVANHDPVKTHNGLDSTETTWVPASEVVITLEASNKVMTWKRKSTGNVPLEEDSIP